MQISMFGVSPVQRAQKTERSRVDPGLGARSLSRVGRLSISLIAFLAILPNLDMHMLQLSEDKFFTGFGLVDPERFVRWYALLVSALLAPAALWAWMRGRRSPLVGAAVALTAVAAGYGVLISAFGGTFSLGFAARHPYTLGFIIFAGTLMLFGTQKGAAPAFLAFVQGAAAAALVKFAYGIVRGAEGVGYQIFADVTSIQGDGGTLVTQSFVGPLCIVVGFHLWRQSRRTAAVAVLILGVALYTGLALSFRRSSLVRALGTLVGALVISGWLHRRAAAGALKGILIAAIMGGIGILAGGIYFGQSVIMERLRSFSTRGVAASDYGVSNSEYLEHWERLPDIVAASGGLGTGFQTGYLGYGPILESTGEFIPLHTGSYEMWASLGLVGILLWAGVLLGLPLVAIARASRARSSPLLPILSFCGAWVLFTALYPIGPPFFSAPQSCILLGASFGCLLNPEWGYVTGADSRTGLAGTG